MEVPWSWRFSLADVLDRQASWPPCAGCPGQASPVATVRSERGARLRLGQARRRLAGHRGRRRPCSVVSIDQLAYLRDGEVKRDAPALDGGRTCLPSKRSGRQWNLAPFDSPNGDVLAS